MGGHDLIRKHLVDHLINRSEIELGRKMHHIKHRSIHSGGSGANSTEYQSFRPSHFNIVAFSDSVHPWSNDLVTLSKESVSVCAQWIKQHLKVKSSPSFLMPPLLYALNNPKVDQVVLITDGLPAEGNIHQLVARTSVAARQRPAHVVLVHTPQPEKPRTPPASLADEIIQEKMGRNNTQTVPENDVRSEEFGRLLVESCGKGSQLRVVRVDVTGRYFDDVTLIRQLVNKGDRGGEGSRVKSADSSGGGSR